MLKEVTTGKIFMGRLNHGEDLLEALTRLCQELKIGLGRIEALGAVQRAVLGFYDQDEKVYRTVVLHQPLEIVHLLGNVSLKEGVPFVHAHVALADHSGQTFGGHLYPGTPVFACEMIIQSLEGASLHREREPTTGLPLWRRE